MSKLTVESIINIYGRRVKEIKAYNEAKRTKVEDFLQIEPVAFSLSDEPDVLRKLFTWQKAYIVYGQFRQYGATTAEILRALMQVEAFQLDYTKKANDAAGSMVPGFSAGDQAAVRRRRGTDARSIL